MLEYRVFYFPFKGRRLKLSEEYYLCKSEFCSKNPNCMFLALSHTEYRNRVDD